MRMITSVQMRMITSVQMRKVTPVQMQVPSKWTVLAVIAGRSAFFKLALAAEDQTVLPHVLDMLATQGRMKYLSYTAPCAVHPGYTCLKKKEENKRLSQPEVVAHSASGELLHEASIVMRIASAGF
eukprot:1161404-Pelagomonas_calceolata.AAC.1